MSDPAALLAAYTDALNRYDMDAVERMFADDGVYASPGLASVMEGRVAIMAAFRGYFAQHKDQVNEDIDVRVVGPHTVECRWSLHSSKSKRTGLQRVRFNEQGLIQRIDVTDD